MAEQNPTPDYSHSPPKQQGAVQQFIHQNPQLAMLIGAAIIVLATLIAYLPAMRAGFIWDDDHYVTRNELLETWDGLPRIWFDIFPRPEKYPLPQYYPLTHTTFWLEYRLWGLNPAGYHINNVLLHIANAMLIWLLLRKLSVPGAWLAAAIFAVHPLNVESVAWVTERKNVLSLLFFLTSLYVYLRFAGVIVGAPKIEAPVKPKSDSPDDEPAVEFQLFTLPDDPQRLYALAAVLFLAALFSKTVAYALPAVVVLILWWKKPRVTAKDLLALVPFVIVGLAMGLLTSYMEKYRVGIALRPGPWHYADSPIADFGARCIIAGQAIWFYVAKLIAPLGLSFNYPRWELNPSNIASYLYPLTAAAAMIGVVALHRRLGGRGTVVAVLVFVGLLFPALGFVNVWPMQFGFVANHFAYFSTIAACALFAAVLSRYATVDVLAGVAATVLVVLAVLSFREAGTFIDSRTLWYSAWDRSGKTSWLAANNYALQVIGEAPEKAEKWFQAGLQINPKNVDALRNLSFLAASRALALQELERAEKAAATQPGASTQPGAASQPGAATLPVATSLPAPRSSADYFAEAIDLCNQAIAIDPAYIDAHFFLGRIYLMLGRIEDARQAFYACLKIMPEMLEPHLMLGRIAMQEGNIDAAVNILLAAAKLHPESSETHSMLGTALMQKGDVRNGLEEWDNAMRFDPKNYRLGLEYGSRLASDGKYKAAAKFFEMAAKADPKAPQVYDAWGLVAVKAGFPKEAKDMFQHALLIDPNYTSARENLAALESGRLKPATTQAASQPATAPQ